MLDPERIYRLAHEGRWAEGLECIHAQPNAVTADGRVRAAFRTFEEAFVHHVQENDLTEECSASLEKLILLHSSGIYRVGRERFEQLVGRLVAWHWERDEDETARQYARFAPEVAVCAEVLEGEESREEANAAPRRVEVEHTQQERIQMTARLPLSERDHTVCLFKSPQEEAFFRAIREAFPTYTPYPNVALSSLVDFEAIRDELSGSERSYFFRGIVDCVLFDQHQGYQPVYFFELDSTHHDDPTRQQNDAYKDRILSLAGHRLYRVRQRAGSMRRQDFVQLLRETLDERHPTTIY